ncbi:hypothetical protein EG327_010932 [Venturia inaequalis]|uniref:DUF2293 domain-containing protein n=1 Tax=Venturia inaequalis TaxID=5025 RepID=A0A8H3UDX7_VENIN|nr:hypothetical protein EG327_010932 [Venturia inaequalis]
MTRVNSTATAVRARRSVSSAIATRNIEKKHQYKVELKLVLSEKRQLKIVRCSPHPRRVFSYANYSQTATDARGRALIVNDPNRVGYYIGRDGFFFPNDVIQKACNWFGVRIDAAGKTTEPNDFLSARVRNALGRYGQRDQRQQIDAAVREMFPRIPPEAADEIIKHAFESASKPGEKERVGNARNLDLAGRVQLAVTAHIRHRYTNYDQLLKNGVKWPLARATVNPPCVAVLRNWMGEDNTVELEETFQEWIDLRDDDEDEDADDSVSMDISDNELQASRNSGDGMVPYVASRPHSPPSMARREPPHPAVPRTGWVNYPTANREGESVRLWHLRGTGHNHEGYCLHCEAKLERYLARAAAAAAALNRAPSPDSAPSPPGSPDVVFVSSNEVV